MGIIAHLHDVHPHWDEIWKVCVSAPLWLTDDSSTTTIRAIQRLVLLLLKDSFYFYNRPLSPNTSQRAPSSHRCAMLNQNTTNTLVSISKLLWLHRWKNNKPSTDSSLSPSEYFLMQQKNEITKNLSTVSGDSDYSVKMVSSWGIFINFGSNNHNSSSLPSQSPHLSNNILQPKSSDEHYN